MTDRTATPAKPRRPFEGLSRRLLSILVGLIVTLVVGWAAETFTSPEWLSEAKKAQQGWMDSVVATSPLAVGELYLTELNSAFTGDTASGGYSGAGAPEGRGWQAPLWALAITGARLWDAAGVVALVQLGMGLLALLVINFWRTKGQSVSFGMAWFDIALGPLAVVALASLLGGALWLLMMGALSALSWITGLAATAAGATGVLGFCWLCVTELTKKGAEHLMTPKV